MPAARVGESRLAPNTTRALGFLMSIGKPPPVLKRRADFLRLARKANEVRPALVLQGAPRVPIDERPARVGYTCSKKIGNAVHRNRAKRRLREAARAVFPSHGRVGWDYVLIGRFRTTTATPMPKLMEQLRTALERLHQ